MLDKRHEETEQEQRYHGLDMRRIVWLVGPLPIVFLLAAEDMRVRAGTN
jgi:hypothetical protein